MKQTYLTVGALLMGLATIGSAPSHAGGGVFHSRSAGQVAACTRYGNYPSCYTAQLQRSMTRKKLGLHHGTRIDCGRDCENTLREATVDFWDTMRENGG